MLLSKIINNDIKLIKRIENDVPISGIDSDSRKIKKGMIFAAIQGHKTNGINYTDKAINAGAKVILCNIKDSKKIFNKNINIITAKNIKISACIICKKFFPSQPKNIAAITGTNGKTSIAYYLNKIWNQAKIKSASIGTLGIKYYNKNIPTELTTPDAIDLIKNVDFLKKQKINFLALEASSHGLSQKRIDYLRVNRGVFSNLSRDHLDYHRSIGNYFASKKRLFTEILDMNGIAIINNYCKYGKKIESICKRKKIKYLTYGTEKSDWVIEKINFFKGHSEVSILIFGKPYQFKTKLKARFQIENLVCSMIVARSYNLPLKQLFNLVENIKEPPGRLEKVNFKKISSNIYIDYAHTPIALKKALIALKGIQSNYASLKVLFGCGGNRDKGKRRLMGKYAFEMADEVYITDDNPRYENPKKIREQILKYCKGAYEISDRKEAIFFAINRLKKFDILLVAGKGHEKYQEIDGKRYFFDDKKVVLDAIKAREKVC